MFPPPKKGRKGGNKKKVKRSQFLVSITNYDAPLDPAPISPKNPFNPLDLSQLVASVTRSALVCGSTQVPELPDASESRYWCISMAKLLY